MRFFYNSTRRGDKRELPPDLVEQLRAYLCGLGPDMTKGELQDRLLAFRDKDGHRLLINQLEPVFTWCAIEGRVWNETDHC